MNPALLQADLAAAEARLAARGYDRSIVPADLGWVHHGFRRDLLAAEYPHLTRFVPADRAALDLGANCGHYSLMLASLCPEVIAFEPLPELACVANALPAWCRWHSLALGDTNDRATLIVPKVRGERCAGMATFTDVTHYGHAVHERFEVERRRLDDVLAEHPPRHPVGFIKIDVEGFEIPVLEGAQETLSRHRPNIFIELWDEKAVTEGVAWFERRGYVGLFFFNGLCHSAHRFDPAVHCAYENRWGVADPFNPQLFVNTFFFIPR